MEASWEVRGHFWTGILKRKSKKLQVLVVLPPPSTALQVPRPFHAGIVLILAAPARPEPCPSSLYVTFPSLLPCKNHCDASSPPPAPWAWPHCIKTGFTSLKHRQELCSLHFCTLHTKSPAGLNQINSTDVRHLRQESSVIYTS